MSRRGALVSIPAIGKGEPGSVPDAVLCPQGRGQFARGIRVARQAESEAVELVDMGRDSIAHRTGLSLPNIGDADDRSSPWHFSPLLGMTPERSKFIPTVRK